MWFQQCLSCSSFLTSPAALLETQMSTWLSLMNTEFPSKAMQGIVLRLSHSDRCVIVLRWTAGGISIPSCPVPFWESLHFQLRQPVCFSLSIFPFLIVLLIPFDDHHWLGRADLWLWCPGSVWLLHQLSY